MVTGRKLSKLGIVSSLSHQLDLLSAPWPLYDLMSLTPDIERVSESSRLVLFNRLSGKPEILLSKNTYQRLEL